MDQQFNIDFIIAGVQKSATTWLYECLEKHPSLNMKSTKNEDAYFESQLFHKNGEEWYQSLFAEKKGLKGCVSVDYIEDLQAITALQQRFPNVKVILSLRNPVERMCSAILWYQRKNLLPIKPIEEILTETVKNPSETHQDLIERSTYTAKLKFLKANFSERMHITLFDDVKQDALKTLKQVFSFLSIDETFVPSNLNTIPKKNTGNKFTMQLQRLAPNSKVVGALVNRINQNTQSSDKKYLLPNTLKEQLNQLFVNDIEEASAVLDLDLKSKWF
ncbi:MAG: sulfotransferase domain-containing protein [Flavobacteriales bacterium]|nr:sulfotransferase domain-containing protein [Flavobacteriales bacterium]